MGIKWRLTFYLEKFEQCRDNEGKYGLARGKHVMDLGTTSPRWWCSSKVFVFQVGVYDYMTKEIIHRCNLSHLRVNIEEIINPWQELEQKYLSG